MRTHAPPPIPYTRNTHSTANPEADDPTVAANIIAIYDDLVAQGKKPHRVTCHFAVTLRAEFQAHADGKGMATELAREIRAYQMCVLDDTWVERQHADIKNIYKRGPSSQVPYVAGGMRMEQTLATVKCLTRPQLLISIRACASTGRLVNGHGPLLPIGPPAKRRSE